MYIGKTPTVGNFQVCDAISVVNGQAAYTLQVGGTNVAPESANHMLVSLNGILQKPGSSFTISGSTMTFASNLATGDIIDFVQILGNVLDIGQPSDDTVTAAKLNNDIISGQTALTSSPDDTDELLISDAGTIKRIDVSLVGGKNTPAFSVYKSSDQGLSDNVNTKVSWNAEFYDTDNAFASDKFTVPSGKNGKYFLHTKMYSSCAGNGNYNTGELMFYKNGARIDYAIFDFRDNPGHQFTVQAAITLPLVATDYVEVYLQVDDTSGNPSIKGTSTVTDGIYRSIFEGFKIIE